MNPSKLLEPLLVQEQGSFTVGGTMTTPQGEVPPAMQGSSLSGALEAIAISPSDFDLLTKIPIVIFYGDNIPAQPSLEPAQDHWRVRLAMATLWADTVNRRGGDATVVHLPALGIRGNTHFPFSDLNNVEVADLLSAYLEKKGLD